MEKVDYQNAAFTARSMVPSSNEELTIPWARRLVFNLVNGYGLIGTVDVSPSGKTGVNLNLSKYFKFPPHVYMYFNSGNGLQEIRSQYFMDYNGRMEIQQPRYSWFIAGDSLIICGWWNSSNPDFTDHSFPTMPTTLYFRVHGV